VSSTAPPDAALFTQLRELNAALNKAGIRYMLIGGFAVAIHGYVRATHDLDVMILANDTDALHEVLLAKGYTAIDRRADLACYYRRDERLDVLYARRPISQSLLARAECVEISGLRIPAISVEGLLGLKIQAFHDDPRRTKDLTDMVELIKVNRASLNIEEVRTYFKLFDSESILDDILNSIG